MWRRVLLEGLGDLNSQLARGRERQHLRPFEIEVEPRQQGQSKCCCLSRAGRGVPEQVVPLEQDKNGLRLDRRRRLIADPVERRQQRLGQIQLMETNGRGGVVCIPVAQWWTAQATFALVFFVCVRRYSS
jgi:hypothetical protein